MSSFWSCKWLQSVGLYILHDGKGASFRVLRPNLETFIDSRREFDAAEYPEQRDGILWLCDLAGRVPGIRVSCDVGDPVSMVATLERLERLVSAGVESESRELQLQLA